MEMGVDKARIDKLNIELRTETFSLRSDIFSTLSMRKINYKFDILSEKCEIWL